MASSSSLLFFFVRLGEGATTDAPSLADGDGIFQNSRGSFGMSFLIFFFCVAFAFEAELGAALYAIDLVRRFFWTKLWIESSYGCEVNIFASNKVENPWRF